MRIRRHGSPKLIVARLLVTQGSLQAAIFRSDDLDATLTTQFLKEAKRMKTMTCKQLGGPCDLPHRGETADEVIALQDKHLKEAVAGGDESHSKAAGEMKGRWKHPISGMKWYKNAKRDFAALPEA